MADARLCTYLIVLLHLTEIPPMTSKIVEILPLSHRQGNCILFAAARWHDFGNRPARGRPFGHFSRHPVPELENSLDPKAIFNMTG